MLLVRSRIPWAIASIAVLIIVAIAGFSGGRNGLDLPPRPLLTGYVDIADLALRTLPRGFAAPDPTTPLLRDLVRDPRATWRGIDATCEMLTAPDAHVARIVDRITAHWTGEIAGTVTAPESGAVPSDPPLRAVGRLGELGFVLSRGSAQNLPRFPARFRVALARLVAAVNRSAAGVRAWRARAGAPEVVQRAAAEMLFRSLSDAARGAPLPADVDACLREFDRAELAAIARALAIEIESALPELRAAADAPFARTLAPLQSGGGIPGGLVFLTETDAGLVVIGGSGRSLFPIADVALAIDLGGDDRWRDAGFIGPAPKVDASLDPPVRVAIDLGGDDEYTSTNGRLGGAAAGVSILIDLAGDDRYGAETLGLGAAVLGVAVLEDDAGEDDYRAAAGLGCGAFGAAALIDLAGDDHFAIGGTGGGAAIGAGFGILCDAWGNDVHLMTNREGGGGPLSYGASAPAAPGGPGGAAIFVDRRGDDIYRPNHRACAFAADGFALAIDGAGDDLYSCGEDSLGAALGGIAVFRDLGGADDYLARARGLGFANRGLGLFLDEGGVDHSLSLAPSRGAGQDGGVGVHADLRDGEALPRR